jgi:hypothetical protein
MPGAASWVSNLPSPLGGLVRRNRLLSSHYPQGDQPLVIRHRCAIFGPAHRVTVQIINSQFGLEEILPFRLGPSFFVYAIICMNEVEVETDQLVFLIPMQVYRHPGAAVVHLLVITPKHVSAARDFPKRTEHGFLNFVAQCF